MGSVRLIKGNDDVLREQTLSTVLDGLVGNGDRGLLVDEHSGSEYGLEALADSAATMPFLTDKRIVVGRHLSRFSNAEALKPLLNYLKDPLDSTDLVLVWERGLESGARLANLPQSLTKAVGAAGGEVISGDPPAKNREVWVSQVMAEHGLNLERAASSLVSDGLGENAGAVVELAERLVGIHGRGSLSADEVRPWLGEAGGVPPWELTDAIDKGNSALALQRLHRMLNGGERHELQVMATLQSHYTRILRLDGAGARNEREAAEVLGIKGSTFPAKKALDAVKRLGSAKIKRSIALLAQADLDLRGAQAWPGDLVLQVLVARLAAMNRTR